MISSFETLKISPDMVHKLRRGGIEEPTPIQAQSIPLILDGKDLIAQSQTGTGKTLAYLLPVLLNIDPSSKQLQAVIVVPTRELGMQIFQETERWSEGTGILPQSLIGGAALSRQVDKLKLHPQIVVGTPGRIVELIKVKKLSMHNVRTIVVDEADQVFDLGSMAEVEIILKSALRDRQILFFSATIPPEIQQIADRWMKDPEVVRIEPAQRTSATVEHLQFVCDERDKIDTLRRLVRLYNPPSAIVFINDTDRIAEVTEKLKYMSLSAEALYGEASKQDRARVMKAFREGSVQLLVATDVASRGLDIENVTHVINLDPPADADHYVHRVGRTGRMGKKGTAINIAAPNELFILRKFEKQLNIDIQSKQLYGGKIYDADEKISQKSRGIKRNTDTAGGSAVRDQQPAAGGDRAPERVHQSPGKNRVPVRVDMEALDSERTDSSSTSQNRIIRKESPRVRGVTGSKTPGKAVPGTADKTKANRERDRKNKGAPKWLKAKQSKE